MTGVGVGVAEREGVTLQELKEKMAEISRERDWDQLHSPSDQLLALVGEVGELSEIFQWKGEVPRGLPYWKEEEKQHLGEELSDVLLYLVRLSDVCCIEEKPHHESWSSMPSNTKSSFARAPPKSTRSSMQKIILLCVAVIMACQAPKTVVVNGDMYK